jgi:alpha-methylacyl-CoA racemase
MPMNMDGPLAGIRIVEMDAIGPVPLAAMLLADMGCDIVRVARPPGAGVWNDVGGTVLHRNRRHVHLDLKARDDCDRALDLIAQADALIEGFRPGVMERLGLGPEIALARNPRLVYARMTGWGQTGPLAPRAGHDINYLSITGALRAMGTPDAPPPVPLNLVGDYGGGAMFAVTGILAALLHVRAGGAGQAIDVAMTDGVSALSTFFHAYRATGRWSDARGANLLDGSAPFYRCYTCADGEFVAVGALEPQFFALLLDGLGLPSARFVQHDRAGWPEMTAAFAAAFGAYPRDHWATVFAGVDACVTPVLAFGEAAAHPQNRTRATLVAPEGVVQPAPAPRFAKTPMTINPARRGETEVAEVLRGWNTAA